MRSDKSRLRSLILSIDKGSLKLEGGHKWWRCYELYIEELVWGRNLQDGWQIHVHYLGSHIGTIDIDRNLGKTTIKVDEEEIIIP